ncbi:MAG: O-antigen ligase family protein [Hyphomicrobium sp.]
MIVASLILGGGARGGYLSDAILQFLSIPCLLFLLWQLPRHSNWPLPKKELSFCAALFLLPLIQLVPLPPAIWKSLPNRDLSTAALELISAADQWAPISISPRATWLSLLSLLPPLAVFIGTVQLTLSERRKLSLVILIVGLISVLVGLLQVAQGPNSPFRFFASTSAGEAVGFFANRNHFAALLYSLMMFAAAWTLSSVLAAGAPDKQNRFDARYIVPLIASFTIFVALVGAQAMARSRAGLGLTILALLGSLALTFRQERGASSATSTTLILGSTALALVFSMQFALYRFMERFEVDPLADSRIAFARNTITAAKAAMPFGTGMGTFVPVYAAFEKPEDAMIDAFANHAHNDWLELWLETGVFGIVLMALFLIWFLARTREVWWRHLGILSDIDDALAKAAALIIALLITHSFVDYTLRTGAIMAILAFSFALLVEAPADNNQLKRAANARNTQTTGTQEGTRNATSAAQNQKASPLGQSEPTGQSSAARDARSNVGERWGKNIEWPDAWRKPSQHDAKPKTDTSRKPEK